MTNPAEPPGRFSLRTPILWVVSAGFACYAVVFIWRSSFVCIDGLRYFSLFDDALVSMRYAWNWVHGLGLVWNPGEYVEGYTNPLMVALMAIPNWIFEEKRLAALSMQVLGAVCVLAIAWLSGSIASRLSPNHRARSGRLAFFAALAYYPLVYWTLMGMEVGLVTLFVLGMLLAYLRFSQDGKSGCLVIAGLLVAGGYLARPDALVPCGLVAVFMLVELFKKGLSRTRVLELAVVPAAIVLVAIGAHLTFRFLYYGEIWPNTYFLKMEGMPLSEKLSNGIGFIAPFLLEAAPLMLLAALAVGLSFDRRKLAIASTALALILYQIYVGGDGWAYWRMLTPVVALLLPLAICEVVRWFSPEGRRDRITRFFAGLAKTPWRQKLATTCVCVLMLVVLNQYFLKEAVGVREIFQVGGNKSNINTALVLQRISTKEARLGVFWAGSIPYYSERHAVDFLGKSDRYIARLEPDLSGSVSWDGMRSVPGHNKYDLGYSISTLAPDYVQGTAWGGQNLTSVLEKRYLSLRAGSIRLILKRDSDRIRWNDVCSLLSLPPGCQQEMR